MPAKKEDDALKSTHFATAHQVGGFAKGTVVSREELDETIGLKAGTSPEDALKVRTAGVKRLLDLGAITPAEAPKEPAEDEDATRQASERVASEAAARKAEEEAARKAEQDEAARKATKR